MFYKTISCLSFALALAATTPAEATPTPEWQVVFGTTGKMPVGAYMKPRLLRDPASDAIYAYNVGLREYPYLAAKLDPLGNRDWSVLERSSLFGAPQHLTALTDGSMVTAHIEVSRYAADGTFVWSVPDEPGQYGVPVVVEVGGELLQFTTGISGVVRLDRATGMRLEILPIEEMSSHCGENVAVAQGDDTVYWVYGCNAMRKLVKVRLAPLRAEWSTQVEWADWSSTVSVAADDDGVHLASTNANTSRLSRFSAADGSLLWSVDGPYGNTPAVVSDVDGDPIVFGASVIEKFDRATGARRWLHTVAGTVADVNISAGAIVVAGNADTGATGFIERLQGSDGASLWQAILAEPAAEWMNLTSVAVQGDRVLVAGVVCAPDTRPERCDLMLWPRDLAGSGTGSTTPRFDLPPPFGLAVKAASDTTIGAALEHGPDGMQLRVKRVRNTDGELLWDVVRPALLPKVPGKLPAGIELDVSDGVEGTVAVLYRSNTINMPHSSDTVVATFSLNSGAFRWERSVIDTTDGYTDGLALHLSVDAAGNVFASSHETVFENNWPVTQSRRQIRKFAAATGQLIRNFDYVTPPDWTGWFLSPPLFRIVDGDVLAEHHPLSGSDYATTRIDGVTGVVRWSSPGLPFPFPWGSSVLDGALAYVASGYEELRVSALDLDTGVESWVSPYSHPSDMSYAVERTYRGSDGAIYAGGYRRIPRPGGSPTAWDARGLLMRLDAGSGVIDWVDRFDTSPVKSPSGQLLPLLDHDGVLYSKQSQARALDSPGAFFTATSTADGTLMGTQVVYLSIYPFPHLGPSVAETSVIGPASDGGTVFWGGFGDASQPYWFGVGKRPAPQPFAGGALRVALTTAVQSLDDELAASFVLDAFNDGTIDAPDVDVLLAIPVRAILGPVSCTVGSVPCTAKVTPSSIGHRLDLAAGEHIRISGSLRHPRHSFFSDSLEASAFSPYGFVEMDMKDNVRSVRLDDILFSQGFD